MKKLKTIIIDDSKIQRFITKKLVEENPFLELYEFPDTKKDVLNIIREKKIELLILDVEMPKMNGFELINALDNPLLILMNSTNPDFALDAKNYGADIFLTKPFGRYAFDSAINELLVKHCIIELRNEYYCANYHKLN